jgi:hypothetical protein
MSSGKEMLMASILAIGLSAGLVTISIGLFSEPIPAARLTVLDAFTQRGGIGINSSEVNFEPFDNVSIYAYLTRGGVSLKNGSVTFDVQTPYNYQIIKTVLTNDSGFAQTDLSLLPSEGHVIGTWHVLAEATVDNEPVVDRLDFDCESQNARMDVFFESNGVSSISFLPSDLVSLEAQLSYRDAPIAGTPVTFNVNTPNGTQFLLETTTTNDLGRANISVRVPWPSTLSLGIWRASAASEVFGQVVNTSASSECYLASRTLDVFTQKAGAGPNTFGGYFLNETVDLYAEVRDEFNQTVPNQVIGFYIRGPNQTDVGYLVGKTNSSGIANQTIFVPSDVPALVGTFEVYARTGYSDIVLLDAVTFVAKSG